jgi:hypothetical protein
MYSDRRLFSSLFVMQLFSSFLVLAGHYTADVDDYIEWTFWENALNQISRYGTVLLAIITGFFTAHSLNSKKTSGTRFFKGKLRYIYFPFLLASVMYFFIMRKSIPVNTRDWEDIFIGQTAGHLYFIFMLCQYYLFAFLFRHIITKKTIWIFGGLFFIMQYAYINIVAHGWFGLGVRHFLPTWIFTLYLGHWLYWYRTAIFTYMEQHRSILLGLLSLSGFSALYFVLSSKLYTANHLIFVLATFVLLVSSAGVLHRVVDMLPIKFHKGLTFYIYLLHPAFIIYANRFINAHFHLETIFHDKWLSALYLLGIYIMTFCASVLCAYFVNRGVNSLPRYSKQPSGMNHNA